MTNSGILTFIFYFYRFSHVVLEFFSTLPFLFPFLVVTRSSLIRIEPGPFAYSADLNVI